MIATISFALFISVANATADDLVEETPAPQPAPVVAEPAPVEETVETPAAEPAPVAEETVPASPAAAPAADEASTDEPAASEPAPAAAPARVIKQAPTPIRVDAPPPVDMCSNIFGIQRTVPVDYRQEGTTCVPDPVSCTDAEQVGIDTNFNLIPDTCVWRPVFCLTGVKVDTNGNGNAETCAIIVPRIDCGVYNADGSRTLHWSYRNPYAVSVTVPTGVLNYHSGGGQPTTFAPGTGGEFTTVIQPGQVQVWELTGHTAWGFYAAGTGLLQTEPCFEDACPNLGGDQDGVPAGMVLNNVGACVSAPPASCDAEMRALDTDDDGVADSCVLVAAQCADGMVAVDTNDNGNTDTCVARGSCIAGSTWTDSNGNGLVDSGECSIVAGAADGPVEADLGGGGVETQPDAVDAPDEVSFNPLNDPEDIAAYNKVVAATAVAGVSASPERTGDDGALPLTGVGLDVFAILGGSLLVLGASLQRGTRRRRAATAGAR